MKPRIFVDGRVYATEAADRGMGRYVRHLCACFTEAGYDVTVLIPTKDVVRDALPGGVRAYAMEFERDPLKWTTTLNRFLARRGAALYLDATPFLPPDRYDVYACPVVAVLYDVIPLRFPHDYFESLDSPGFTEYINGLARVQKADHVVAISDYVKGHALRYLGVPRDRCTVVVPDVDVQYRAFASADGAPSPGKRGIVSIQGAHRSKNFPAAIRFLERLAHASGVELDMIVPTAGQRERVEAARESADPAVCVWHSLDEPHKFALQRDARAIAHLSLDEGYGIPLAEALYLQRPIVCIDNAINRELIGGEQPASAGILLLGDPSLTRVADLHAAAQFVSEGPRIDYAAARRRIVARLEARQDEAHAALAGVFANARTCFDAWHARAGLALAAPTEFGSCGVSDYCHALARGEASRYLLLLGPAPRELQLERQLRLLPVSLLEEVRDRTPGVVFNLAISPSLSRAFDAIAERSSERDVLVVHDAGSYLPGLLALASMSGDRKIVFDRWLRDESEELRRLSSRWLDQANRTAEEAHSIYLQLDRMFRSLWLRAFRGEVVSHHAAFARPDSPRSKRLLAMLPAQSELRTRTRFAPMPIDVRATPGLVRFAAKMRWALGLAREDVLVCCAGSIVQGKHLDVVARVVARLDEAARSTSAQPITLLLAGRIIDHTLFSALSQEFSSRGVPGRMVHVLESNETRYDAFLMASDVVVAFREQRYIQMSHSYVRSLALGRPIITNEGAGFDDQEAAAVCRDDHLDEDLERHLMVLRDAESARDALARASQLRFRARHTVDRFFASFEERTDAAAAL